MKLIERDFYLDKLTNVIGTPDIKVITGVRRSGKSKLLEAFKRYVASDVPNANVVHIRLGGISVTVAVNGKPIHDIDISNPRSVSKMVGNRLARLPHRLQKGILVSAYKTGPAGSRRMDEAFSLA